MPLNSSLNDLTSLARGAPLKSLCLSGYQHEGTPEAWKAICGAFPDLQEVILEGEGSPEFWKGLNAATADRGLNEDHPVACAGLTHVCFSDNNNPTGGFFTEMIDCLGERARRGYRLHFLDLDVLSTETEGMEGYTSQLDQLVDHLYWTYPYGIDEVRWRDLSASRGFC